MASSRKRKYLVFANNVGNKEETGSSNIAFGDVNGEAGSKLEEPNISELTNASERSKDELQKLWDKNTSLLDAIATHNNTEVISLLENGASPNATTKYFEACHIAAFSNDEALRILLDAGAERRRFDIDNITPLHCAAWNNGAKRIAMLLGFPEGLTNKVATANRTLTPDQEDQIQETGARVKSFVDSNETTVFHSAFGFPDECWANDLGSFSYYETGSSNIAFGDVNGEAGSKLEEPNISELTNASERSKDELQKLWDKNTSLLDAIATHNNTEVISLLENGASPNATTKYFEACHIAAFSNDEALRILLDAGAERRRFDIDNITPLHCAAWNNGAKRIAMLLGFPEGLTNKVATANRTLTPDQEDQIQETGARVKSFVDSNETTVFHSAFGFPDECWANDLGSFSYYHLRRGYSALHAACAAHPHCARLLLAAGADPNLRDEENATPLDVAGTFSSDKLVQSYVETLELLRKYGAKVGKVNWRVLNRAMNYRSLQALKLLLEAGAPINHQNPSGYTPIHLCSRLRDKELLEVSTRILYL